MKQFFATITMQEARQTKYVMADGIEVQTDLTRFPSVIMLEKNLRAEDSDEDYELILIQVDDGSDKVKQNYELYLEELKQLSDRLGRNILFKEENRIIVPNDESRRKHSELFRKICGKYKDKAEVFMELTYGTKPTTIDQYCTLVYAEKAKKCRIAGIYYGLYSFNTDAPSTIFDIKYMYDMSMLINSIADIPGADIDKALSLLGGQ